MVHGGEENIHPNDEESGAPTATTGATCCWLRGLLTVWEAERKKRKRGRPRLDSRKGASSTDPFSIDALLVEQPGAEATSLFADTCGLTGPPNEEVFESWFQNVCRLAKIRYGPCDIYLCRETYNERVHNPPPSDEGTPIGILCNWLQIHNIPFPEDACAAELFLMCQQAPSPNTVIQEIAALFGHCVHYIPDMHQELSPLDVAWQHAEQQFRNALMPSRPSTPPPPPLADFPSSSSSSSSSPLSDMDLTASNESTESQLVATATTASSQASPARETTAQRASTSQRRREKSRSGRSAKKGAEAPPSKRSRRGQNTGNDSRSKAESNASILSISHEDDPNPTFAHLASTNSALPSLAYLGKATLSIGSHPSADRLEPGDLTALIHRILGNIDTPLLTQFYEQVEETEAMYRSASNEFIYEAPPLANDLTQL
mmetsp:Transcript_1377/g.4292  ORF Transcript_1377/g.4292 Transcript_1377/m.4292 type:complete len:431 (-) Transcript_1377:10-1302(-)